MAVRSIIAFAVMIAMQALAGCGMPATSDVAHDDRPVWRKAEFDVREERLRGQVEAGTLGLAQLFPGGVGIDARHLPPLPPPSAILMPVVSLIDGARSSPPETQVHLAFAASSRQKAVCVYKPIMSDADIDACR
jgi:hypothetical protein